jgi:hypothetical protein
MADEPENMVLLQLRAIRDAIDRLADRQSEDRGVLRHIEQELIGLRGDITGVRSYLAEQTFRLDRVSDRLDRIEKRLGLVEADV